MATKMNADLINKVQNAYKEIWQDERMYNYCVKKTKNAVEMHNGGIVTFENEKIKTQFWFGYYTYGSSFDDTNKRIENLEKDKLNYFYKANLKDMFDNLKKISKNNNYEKPYIVYKYGNDTKIACINFYNDYDFNRKFKDSDDVPVKMTAEDIEKYNAIIKIERKRFVTRLNAYVKKYGVSKVELDSYWADR